MLSTFGLALTLLPFAFAVPVSQPGVLRPLIAKRWGGNHWHGNTGKAATQPAQPADPVMTIQTHTAVTRTQVNDPAATPAPNSPPSGTLHAIAPPYCPAYTRFIPVKFVNQCANSLQYAIAETPNGLTQCMDWISSGETSAGIPIGRAGIRVFGYNAAVASGAISSSPIGNGMTLFEIDTTGETAYANLSAVVGQYSPRLRDEYADSVQAFLNLF